MESAARDRGLKQNYAFQQTHCRVMSLPVATLLAAGYGALSLSVEYAT
jgi:hypothetical protein